MNFTKTGGMVRKMIILVIGLTIVGIGLALLVLPGPAILVIPAGLAVLGTEFIWARRLLQRMKEEVSRVGAAVRGRPRSKVEEKDNSTKLH